MKIENCTILGISEMDMTWLRNIVSNNKIKI
ncbi:hypothetical protein M2142_001976 [Fusobacterium sp. PH5-29]